MSRLISYLPQRFLEDPIMQNTLNREQDELDSLNIAAIDLLSQFFPQTATWGLKYWESFLGLVTNESTDITIRRQNILAKIGATSPVTCSVLKNMVAKYASDSEIVQDFANYHFDLNLITQDTFNIVLEDIFNTIDEVKPAHLEYSLGLETQKTINVASSRTYSSNSNIDLCGQFNCGDSNVVSAIGRSYDLNLALHGDYNKNIKDYALAGTILSSLSSEFESGIATIGRVYSAAENIKAIRDYLYDNQLSKTDGSILGAIHNTSMQVAPTYNKAINTYDEAGVDEAGQFMTGSNENLDTTIGKAYESTLQEASNESDSIKEYSLTGEILTSTEVVV